MNNTITFNGERTSMSPSDPHRLRDAGTPGARNPTTRLVRTNPKKDTDMKEETKQSALKNLIDAGYAAALTATGLEVRGENWSVHYADRGQDFNEYHGDVPGKVEELAVWNDPTTRTEKA